MESNILKRLPERIKVVENLSKAEENLPRKLSFQKFFTLCFQFYTQIKTTVFKRELFSMGSLETYPVPKTKKLEGYKETLRVGIALFLNTNFSHIDLITTKHFAKIEKELLILTNCEECFCLDSLNLDVSEKVEEKESEPGSHPLLFHNLISNPNSLLGGGLFQNLSSKPANSN